MKEIVKLRLEGLLVGTGLVAGINLIGMLDRPEVSFYNFTVIVYLLTGLILGFLRPKLSWQWGLWLTLPWIAWIFYNVASTGFKEGMGSILLMIFYFFPILPACAGAYLGARLLKSSSKTLSNI